MTTPTPTPEELEGLLARANRTSETSAELDDALVAADQFLEIGPWILARIRALEEGIEDIRAHTDPDDPESYRADDREGCLDTVQAIAAALTLNKEKSND